MKRNARLLALAGALSMIAVACGSDTTSGPAAAPSMIDRDRTGRGRAQPGRVGELHRKSWVKPFEDETGCMVNPTYANTSDEMVNLMRQNDGADFDGVSASGDSTFRFIANGDVAPIDTSLVPRVPGHDELPAGAGTQHDRRRPLWRPLHVGSQLPDVQHRRRDDAAHELGLVFEPAQRTRPYAGKITAYDSAIYIADAAIYLKTHQPDLGITDPYELTSDQLDAAINLLKQQNGLVSKYWNVWSDEVDAFESGDMVAGTAWPANQNVLISDAKVNVASVTPDEGVTGWADTWMMSSNAPHPNCMLAWMNYTLSDKVQAATAYTFGATPSVTTACKGLKANLIAGYGQEVGTNAYPLYRCGDDSYLSSIYLWKTPVPDCGNGSTDCTDYNTWTQKWFEVRGA